MCEKLLSDFNSKKIDQLNNFQLISDYKNIDKYRLSFNKLANEIFGADFENWYQAGFWDSTCICYSYVNHDEVIANVSVSKLNMLIEDQEVLALQIGTVMTHPEYRGKGLARKLMEYVLNEYESKCDLMYLFANKNVLNFYPKFGFEKVGQCRFSIDISNKSYREERKLIQLNISRKDDLEIIRRLSQRRVPISKKLSVKNDQSIFGWYCLNTFKDNLYYLEKEEIIFIYKAEGEILHLYDVVSDRELELESILDKIASSAMKKVIFYFTPNIAAVKEEYDDLDDTFFVKPIKRSIPENLAYPITAHT